MMESKPTALTLGALPVELVNRLLDTMLLPGYVIFRAAQQHHAFDRHKDEYMKCRPFIGLAITEPTYIGQSPHHESEFEMVRQTDSGMFVLVAVSMSLDGDGMYPVQSVYPIDRGTVMRRVRKRHLFTVPL